MWSISTWSIFEIKTKSAVHVWIEFGGLDFWVSNRSGITMDPQYKEILKHLEKQDKLLKDAYRSMSHEWQKLKLEEEMLMRAFMDLMAAQGLMRKKKDVRNILGERESPQSKAAVNVESKVKQ
ncbi:hypothetical protein L2E82_07486 [Cichorium intybus]|uniref:Uncharacterized protein n=1 Tax=Cichorium intybus TaxID=13427 RepID=A0ACB9G505_CICIN|nr:hypothetical protein L2E82_07486 [Cichorium intybus]